MSAVFTFALNCTFDQVLNKILSFDWLNTELALDDVWLVTSDARALPEQFYLRVTEAFFPPTIPSVKQPAVKIT